MNWRYVDVGEASLIHQVIIKRAGTKAGVRDFGLLHSAVERPRASFGGEDLYPGVFEKAAALMQSMTMNHPFTDGNKRTAWAVTHMFLWINGQNLKARNMEGADFMVAVDNEKLELKEIAAWLRKHCKSRVV